MKINAFLTVKDLTEMGFGNRVTIWKKVRNNEFPAPIKFGNSSTCPNHWLKEDIDEYVANLKAISRSKGQVNYGLRNRDAS